MSTEDKDTSSKNLKTKIILFSLIGLIIALSIIIALVYINNKDDFNNSAIETCAVTGCDNEQCNNSEFCEYHIRYKDLYDTDNSDNSNDSYSYDYSTNDSTTYTEAPTQESYSKHSNRSSKSSNKGSSNNSSYPSNPKNYSDFEDYYYDNEEDFDGIDDAEDYYEENGGEY